VPVGRYQSTSRPYSLMEMIHRFFARPGASAQGARRTWRLALALTTVSMVSGAIGAAAQAPDKSPNVEHITRLRYPGESFFLGSDLDFSGRYAYGGQIGDRGGVHIFDVRGEEPRQLGYLHCPGSQNDVAVVKPGLLALGYHTSRCSPAESGIQLIDVSDPARPRLLGAVAIPGGGTHTLTVVPGRSLIYSSPGGSGSPERIVDVSNPQKPKIVATFEPGERVGCHDVVFDFTGGRELGFCAGDTATQVWDMSDPLKPKVLSEIVNPLIYFHHSVAASPDGRYLVIGDEGNAFCSMPVNHPVGGLFVYDIEDPSAPELVSFFGLQRESLVPICTAHNFNFVPATRLLVSSWYSGGMTVIDLADAANPKEIAHYRDEETDYWSAYWYNGRIYASGRPGLDVFELRR
jgi:hypothetical protein